MKINNKVKEFDGKIGFEEWLMFKIDTRQNEKKNQFKHLEKNKDLNKTFIKSTLI